MFGILDVAIGLVLVVTLVSLVCSVINEWISGILSKRGQMLWEGIYHLVGQDLADRICAHHLLQGLSRESWFDRLPVIGRLKRAKPSYVPTRLFVMALMDVMGQRAKEQAAPAAPAPAGTAPAAGAPAAARTTPVGGTFPADLGDLKAAIEALPPSSVRQALLALVDDAGDRLDTAKKNLGDWFDDSMNRVSGWYKRWSQLVLLAVSIVVALVLGVDILQIGKQLWADPALREATASAAARFVEERASEMAAAEEGGSAEPEAALESPEPPEPPEVAAGDANAAEDTAAAAPADAGAEEGGASPATPETPESDAAAEPDAAGQETATPEPAPATDSLAKDLHEDLSSLMGEFQNLGLPLAPFDGAEAEYTREKTKAEVEALASMKPWRRTLELLLFWLGQHGLGLLLTGLAASLGAPFWFDLLNKFVTLRASGKPPVEAKKES